MMMTPSCCMVKIGPLDDPFLNVFLTTSKPTKRSITTAKRKEKEKKGREKNSKIEKPKDVGHVGRLKILISVHAWAKRMWNMI